MRSRKRKLRFLDSSAKGQANEFIQGFGDELKGYIGLCLFVTGSDGKICGRHVRERHHVISRSSVLDQLKDKASGKVMELGWDVSEWRRLLLSSDEEHPMDLDDPSTFVPRDVGTHDACARWFACELHDGEFGPIDGVEPDFNDSTVRFLTMYRAVLCAADLCRHRQLLHKRWNKQFMRSHNRAQRAHWAIETAEVQWALEMANDAADSLGRIWYAKKDSGHPDPNLIAGQVLCFRSTLRFAGCVIYGAGVAATVVPSEKDMHKIVLLYLAGDENDVSDDYDRLVQSAKNSLERDDYGVGVIDTLMTRGNGPVAVSPGCYQALPDGDRLVIQQIVADKMRASSIAMALSSQQRGAAENRRRKSPAPNGRITSRRPI